MNAKIKLLLLLLLTIQFYFISDAQNAPREIWLASRTDGKEGTGTLYDPLDVGSTTKLNQFFKNLYEECAQDLTINFKPGVYYGDRPLPLLSKWRINGAGIDQTIFKTEANPNSSETIGFKEIEKTGEEAIYGVEVSNCTFDFNILKLRKANRVFAYFRNGKARVFYRYLKKALSWQASKTYNRGDAVIFEKVEYIATSANQGEKPKQGKYWSVLNSLEANNLPAWFSNKKYKFGEIAAFQNGVYISCKDNNDKKPGIIGEFWKPVKLDNPDPMINTCALKVLSKNANGGNKARRVKLINGYGSSFFNSEAFLIKLGGDNCLIENCRVELFRGDCSTCLFVFGGRNNVIRGCSVNGDSGEMIFAYGGSGNSNNIFENNYAYGVRCVANIDSLNSKNVVFRNNIFMNCRQAGIHVDVTKSPDSANSSSVDGLFVYDNFIELQDTANKGAIILHSNGSRNVRIFGNVIRSISGKAEVPAIIVSSNTQNVTIFDNSCESAMKSKIPTHAFCYDNYDFQGDSMKGIYNRGSRGALNEKFVRLNPASDLENPKKKIKPLTVNLLSNGEIPKWLVLGPFPHPPQTSDDGETVGAGYDFDFLHNFGGEANVKPETGLSMQISFPKGDKAEKHWGKEILKPFRIEWLRVSSDETGFVDASQIPKVKISPDSTCVYAACYLRSPKTQSALVKLGSDDGFILYFNGVKIGEVRDDRRGYRKDSNSYMVRLKKGNNLMILKVVNYWGGFGWGARIINSEGFPIKGLKDYLP